MLRTLVSTAVALVVVAGVALAAEKAKKAAGEERHFRGEVVAATGDHHSGTITVKGHPHHPAAKPGAAEEEAAKSAEKEVERTFTVDDKTVIEHEKSAEAKPEGKSEEEEAKAAEGKGLEGHMKGRHVTVSYQGHGKPKAEGKSEEEEEEAAKAGETHHADKIVVHQRRVPEKP